MQTHTCAMLTCVTVGTRGHCSPATLASNAHHRRPLVPLQLPYTYGDPAQMRCRHLPATLRSRLGMLQDPVNPVKEVPWQEEPNTPAPALMCEYALCCHSAVRSVCALPCSPHVRTTTVRTLRHQMRCLLRSHATQMTSRTLQPHLQQHLIQRTFRQDSRCPDVLFAAWAGPGA